MAGIEGIKSVLKVVIGMATAYDKAREDGKFDASDLSHLVGPMVELPGAISAFKDVPAEWKDMDSAEQKELVDWAKVNFAWSDAEAEKTIEDAFGLAVHVAGFVAGFAK